MGIELNISQVSKLTGLEVPLLLQMRSRGTRSIKSGPPYCKTLSPEGNAKYTYKKHEVERWLKRRRFQVTAGDAAGILGISRGELLGYYGHGVHHWHGPNGRLVISAGKNIFIWIPNLALGSYGLKKLKH